MSGPSGCLNLESCNVSYKGRGHLLTSHNICFAAYWAALQPPIIKRDTRPRRSLTASTLKLSVRAALDCPSPQTRGQLRHRPTPKVAK